MLLSLAKKYSVKINLDLIDNLILNTNTREHVVDNSFNCYSPFHLLIIRANGDVPYCDNYTGKIRHNIKKESLKDVWFSSDFSEFRKKILSKNFDVYCKRCQGINIMENKQISKNV